MRIDMRWTVTVVIVHTHRLGPQLKKESKNVLGLCMSEHSINIIKYNRHI